MHIPNALNSEACEHLYEAAHSFSRFSRVLNSDSRSWDIPVDQWTALPVAKRDSITQAANVAAATGFQYFFETYRLSDEIEAGRSPGGRLEEFVNYINNQEFLDWLRALTGDPRPTFCDAQVTRFMPGDFLTTHDDEDRRKGRLYAFVLNLTPVWRVDWGGLLLFVDDFGNVAEGYSPKLNALNIFKVPQRHCVSAVTPFARAPRISITGWVRH